MVAREIERIIWAKEALKSVIKHAHIAGGTFTDDVPFDRYYMFIGDTSRDDEDLI